MRKPRDRATHHEFAKRLNHMLQQKGYSSGNAKSGVRIKELASAADCSTQMAHRYVNGLAMPDFVTLKRIADWLGVAGGWLLYGEDTAVTNQQTTQLCIDEAILDYTLQKALPLFVSNDVEQVTQFLKGLLADVAQISADQDVLIKYIDIATSTVKRFQKPGLSCL